MRSIHSFSMTSSMSGDFMESPLKFTWSPVGQVAQITRRYLAFSIYGVSFWSISSPHHLSSSSSRSAISTRWPPTTTNHDNKPSAPTNRHRLYPSKCFLPPHSVVCLQTASEHLALHLPLPTCPTSSHQKARVVSRRRAHQRCRPTSQYTINLYPHATTRTQQSAYGKCRQPTTISHFYLI